jgi:hypothetical protein
MEVTTMHEHNSVGRLVGVLLALLITVGIGAAAYQAGVQHGIALQIPAAGQAGGTAVAPPPFAYYPYYWYRPWGFGFAGPFLFILLWLALARTFFWGGRRRWRYMHDGPYGFDEWHRRAHDRMRNEPPTPTNV